MAKNHCVTIIVDYMTHDRAPLAINLHRRVSGTWLWAPIDHSMPHTRLVIKPQGSGVPRTEIPAQNIASIRLEKFECSCEEG